MASCIIARRAADHGQENLVHLAVVDCNPASLAAITLAKQAGHRVSYFQPVRTQYAPTFEHKQIVNSADFLVEALDTTDAATVRDALAACHATHPIDAVVTFNELAAEAVAVSGRSLRLRGTSADAVLTARQKDRCRAALSSAGLASARYAVAMNQEEALEAAERIGYPVVIKPRSGSASLLAHTARNRQEAIVAGSRLFGNLDVVPEHWRRQFTRGALIEELLEGILVSVEIGARDGEFFTFCVSRRLRWREDEVIELGSCIPANLTPSQTAACVAYAEAACRAIGADLGVFHVEIMVTEHGPVLVEFNPRVMGGGLPRAYAHATGESVYASLVEILAGEAVSVPGRFADCVAVIAVIAAEPGRLASTANLSALTGNDEILDIMGFDNYRTGPGAPVHYGQAVARFVLRARDYQAVVKRSNEFLGALERPLGLRLAIGDIESPRPTRTTDSR
jgi:biotin carboxylase